MRSCFIPLAARVAHHALETPDQPALVCGPITLTYHELHHHATQLAQHLRQHGTSRDTPIGIAMHRSPAMVVALFAVLYAGGAYVPLDPSYPHDRLAWMIQDSGLALLLTQAELSEQFADLVPARLLVDLQHERQAPRSSLALPEAQPHDLAYIIYTSGSTGRPKGVMIEQQSLALLSAYLSDTFPVGAGARVLQFASLSFDASVWELAMALGSGATLVIADEEVRTDPRALTRLIQQERITIATLPPTLLALLEPEVLPTLQTVISAGEACPEPVARRWAAARTFVNAYGPTESTVCATLARWTPADAGAPSIGTPLPYVRAYVLDQHGLPLEPGAAGQLYLGGPALARGYLNRPALTAERFVPSPLDPQERLYATGDLARWRADGGLDFLGRIDAQVKIRGHRVELGEIEAVLAQHPAVRACAVVAREAQLWAYVINDPALTLSPAALRAYIATLLPDWMVPARVVLREQLPLTPSGKVDRRALSAEHADVAPVEVDQRDWTPMERSIAPVWETVLGVPAERDASFFDLGGDSLRAAQLVVAAERTVGVPLSIATLLANPTLRRWSAVIARTERAEEPLDTLDTRDPHVPFPLLAGQQQLALLEQLAQPLPLYHETVTLTWNGALALDRLHESLHALAQRHPMLRAALTTHEQMIVLPDSAVPLIVGDVVGETVSARAEAAYHHAAAVACQPFTLTTAPLWRALYLAVAPDRHHLYLTFHHIIIDGISLGVVVRDLVELYEMPRDHVPARAPSTPVNWPLLSATTQRWRDSPTAATQRAYWHAQLDGAIPTPIPLANRATGSPMRGGRVSHVFSANLVAQIDAVGRQEQATRFMVLAAAVAILLARYTEQGDITFGTMASLRTPHTDGAVGYLLNTLPLRVTFDDDACSFRQALQRMRQTVLSALDHRELPFSEITPMLRASGAEHTPMVLPVMVTLEPTLPVLPIGWEVRATELDLGVSKFDLAFVFEPTADGLRVTAQYAHARFNAETAERILSHLDQVLHGALATPDASIWHVPMLAERERAVLLEQWQFAAPTPLPPVPALIRAHARQHPTALAVDDGRQQLTYAELDAAAARLAALLKQCGVGSDTPVAVCVPAGVNVIIASYAVLLAGGCYVPLDPALPAARLRWMIEDSGAVLLLAETTTAAHIATALPCCMLDTDWQATAPPPILDDGGVPTDSLAYIMYTSGSTGQPKGVMVTHANLSQLISWHCTAFSLRATDRTTQIAGLGFDAAVWEIWPTLASGAALSICDPHTRLDPAALQRWLIKQQISVAFVPTPLAEPLLDLEWPPTSALRVLLTGGDVLHRPPPPGLPFRLINNYGPTENTVVATSGEVVPGPTNQRPDIGHPIAGVRAYVLDRHRELVPIGGSGELYLGGEQVARGYLHRPELDAERFLADPFVPGGRMYATGDLVRWNADGRIDFIGRNDTQVKLRGQRIELGEIEAWLLRVAPLQAATALIVQQGEREPILVAYGVARTDAGSIDTASVRAALAHHLSTAMVPQEIIMVDALPITPNGKVDRAALAHLPLPLEATRDRAQDGPLTATEMQLAALWAKVTAFPVEQIDRATDFFDVGGSSLLIARLVTMINQQFGISFPLALAFSESTLSRQAQTVEQLRRDGTAYTAALDLDAECQLPDDITAPQAALPRGNTFQHVFLTGATGFLGVFLLRELLRTSNATVVCLVRASDPASGFARLASVYTAYTGEALPDASRVTVCPGDLTAAQLGIDASRWASLAATVDTIIHCAANVSFVLPYAQLKSANVGGTIEVLRLSAAGGGIPVHHISTGGVFGATPALIAKGCIHEDDPLEPSKDHLHMGYLQSKWVAERCVTLARARHIPVAIYRPGIVMGTQATGICNTDDYLPRMILGCAQLGSYPDSAENKSIVPVDYAASAIVTIARQTASLGDVFHIVNPHGPITVADLFARLRQLGCDLHEQPRHAWMTALLAPEAETNALAPLAFLFTQPVQGTATLFDLFERMPPFVDAHTQAALRGSGVVCEPISDELLNAWLNWYVSAGLLDLNVANVG